MSKELDLVRWTEQRVIHKEEPCPICLGRRTVAHFGCFKCRERWHDMPLSGTPSERYFATIVRGGKIAGKGGGE